MKPRTRLQLGLLLTVATLLTGPPPTGAVPPWQSSLLGPPTQKVRAFEAALEGPLDDGLEPSVRLALGAAYAASGRKDEATAEWVLASSDDAPLWEYAVAWRARELASAGREGEARPLWERLFAAGGEPSFKEEAAEALVKDSERRGAPAESIPYLEALRVARPDDAGTLARLAGAYGASGLGEKEREAAGILWRDFPASAKSVELFKGRPDLEARAREEMGPEIMMRLRNLAAGESWWRLERELAAFRPEGPEEEAWARFLKGRLAEGRRQFQGAKASYEAASKGPAVPAGEALAALARVLPSCKPTPAQMEGLEDRLATYSGPSWDAVESALVRRMKLRFRADEEERAQEIALRLLVAVPWQEDAHEVLYERAWTLWMAGDRPGALSLFGALSEKASAEGDYRYAASFSLWKLGLLPEERARAVRDELEREYRYGYFGYRVRGRAPGAAGPVRQPFSDRPPASPGTRRYKGDLLASVGLWDEASREYRASGASEGQRAPSWDLALMEASRGVHRRAIFFARRAFPDAHGPSGGTLPEEVWRVLYPLPYAEEIRSAAATKDLPYLLLTALVRQESGFDAEARSSANALGLAQLLPATGRHTARKHGLPAPGKGSFFDPGWNLAVGAAYFSDQLERFGGRADLALAAYNAGPHRVEAWLKRPGCPTDPALFVESIPFRETRSYVRRILGIYWEYNRLYPGEAAPPPAGAIASLAP